MKDAVKDLLARMGPQIPDLTLPPPAVARAASPPSDRDDGQDEDITAAALDEAEESLDPEDQRDARANLGIFHEKDYAERIAGWEFKTETLYVEGIEGELEAYYRRPLHSPAGTKWQRIGHERSGNALELRRLVHCARRRDARVADDHRRHELIEELFGPGTVPLVYSLLAVKGPESPPPSALTPRQEAFCRNFLTEPNATRAAILAGYGEAGAAVEGHRLLRNAKILARISMLRREKGLSYCFDRDSLLDRLEWVFGEAMEGRDYTTAIRALLAQAQMFGVANKRHAGTERAETRARVEPAAVRDSGSGVDGPPLPLAPQSR